MSKKTQTISLSETKLKAIITQINHRFAVYMYNSNYAVHFTKYTNHNIYTAFIVCLSINESIQ